MSVIVTRSTASQGGSGSGVFTQAEKLALEMEMEFKAANASYYKELYYKPDNPNKGNLISAGIWTTTFKTLRLFAKDLNYYESGSLKGNLDNTLLLRDLDNAQLLKIFNYDDNENLASIQVSAG